MALLKDELGYPIPQYQDAAGTGYEAWKGLNGAGRVLLWGPDGTALMTAANPGIIQGPAAHDAAASGNPVQAGGVYRVADPVLADGDVGSIRVNAKGEVLAQLSGSIAENLATKGKAGLTGIATSSVAASTEVTDYTYTEECWLENLEFSTNNINCVVNIYVANESDAYTQIAWTTLVGVAYQGGYTFNDIVNNKIGFWTVINNVAGQYKASHSGRLYCPNGVKITRINWDAGGAHIIGVAYHISKTRG